MTVSQALFRFYRPIILIFSGIIVIVELIGVGINVVRGELNFSMWLVFAGQAARYWLLVVAIMLVAMNMRQVVSNGPTRHEFVAGSARFMLILSVGFAAAVALGHGLESFLVGLAGQGGPDYPVATAGRILSEFGHALPSTLAWPLSGALIAVGFYRYKAWTGLIVMVLGALPALMADFLVRINEFGHVTHRGPYALALLASLAITAVAAVAFQRLMSDVPIRRTAG